MQKNIESNMQISSGIRKCHRDGSQTEEIFGTMHMTFEFQGRDLSFKFFHFFIQLRSIRTNKNIM